MVECIRFVNSRFTSNTYILSIESDSNVWVIDPGDTGPLFSWMKENGKAGVNGILLTHSHFDHIYGICEVLEEYPKATIYVANEEGKNILFDSKKNGSKYTEEGPLIIKETAEIRYFEAEMKLWPNIDMVSIITPGHSEDSICLIIHKMIFTGDTLIKDFRTVTKLKGGSVEKLSESLRKLENLKGSGFLVYGGHCDVFDLDTYDLRKAILSIG
jgi:glyoxylase-like metal-dependent hydrolase (beta-lactamase superfamily II)